MAHSAAELGTGAAVLLLAAGFLGYAVVHSGVSAAGYRVTARFSDITGLATGADVRIGGVKIGTVTAESLDPATYQAVVTLALDSNIKIPKDSSAAVTSEGLLGGSYVALSPGGAAAMLANGGRITATQSAVNLMQLVGKYIFSGAGKSGGGSGGLGQ